MGLPDATDAGDYGLPLNDFDFVADPTTELAAALYETMATDVSAMTHVSPRAWVKCNAAGAILDHDAVWGDSVAVAPTVTFAGAGTGHYTVQWAASHADLNPTPARQVTRTTDIRTAIATQNTPAVNLVPCRAALTDSRTVDVYFGSGGAKDDPTVWSLLVF